MLHVPLPLVGAGQHGGPLSISEYTALAHALAAAGGPARHSGLAHSGLAPPPCALPLPVLLAAGPLPGAPAGGRVGGMGAQQAMGQFGWDQRVPAPPAPASAASTTSNPAALQAILAALQAVKLQQQAAGATPAPL